MDAMIDPYNGKILETVVWESTPIGILYDLHRNLFLGESGAVINSLAGLSLVLIGVTGLYLWPGWRSLKQALVVKWRSGRYRLNYDLHKVIGMLAVMFLFMWAFTAAAQTLLPEPPEPLTPVRSEGKAIELDRLVQIGDAALPGELTAVYPIQGGTILVYKRVPGDLDPYGYSYVAVNKQTGKITQVYDLRAFPVLWRIRAAMYAIHVGSPGGIVLRYMYAFFGVAPAVLTLTAFLMWLSKLKRAEMGAARGN